MMAHSVLIVPAMDGSFGVIFFLIPFGIGILPIALLAMGILAKLFGQGLVELGLWAYRTHGKRAAAPAQSDVPLRSRTM